MACSSTKGCFRDGTCQKEVRDIAGASQDSLTVTPTVGSTGPIWVGANSLRNNQLFNREKIPPRPVHAKGGVAFGKFKCTSSILGDLTDNVALQKGKITSIVARFSTVIGDRGSPDAVREPRGFAVRFYTDQGNWDLVGNNTPTFFLRDPALFNIFVNSQRPQKDGLPSSTNQTDWFSLRPECMMQLMFMFTRRGIPTDFRHMDGFSSHTYILHKKCGKKERLTAVQFHWRSRQGIRGLSDAEAATVRGNDVNSSVRDLRDSIAKKNFPQWDLFVQLVPIKKDCHGNYVTVPKDFPIDINDLTKVWPTTLVKEVKVGEMILDRNPKDNFTQNEELAFCVSNFIPGIGPSNDRVLQFRILAYTDQHLYRIGANFHRLDVNKPRSCPISSGSRAQCPFNFVIDGSMADGYRKYAIYAPNSYPPTPVTPVEVDPKFKPSDVPPPVVKQDLDHRGRCSKKEECRVGYTSTKDDDNYSQPCMFYLTMPFEVRNELAANFASFLNAVLNEKRSISKEVYHRFLSRLGEVSSDLRARVVAAQEGTVLPPGPPVKQDTGYEFMLP